MRNEKERYSYMGITKEEQVRNLDSFIDKLMVGLDEIDYGTSRFCLITQCDSCPYNGSLICKNDLMSDYIKYKKLEEILNG